MLSNYSCYDPSLLLPLAELYSLLLEISAILIKFLYVGTTRYECIYGSLFLCTQLSLIFQSQNSFRSTSERTKFFAIHCFGRIWIWMLVDPCLEKKHGNINNLVYLLVCVFYLWFNLIYFCCKLNKKVIYCVRHTKKQAQQVAGSSSSFSREQFT